MNTKGGGIMDIKPYDKTIRDLLGSKRQFIIPRFQREYSWEKKNYKEFFEDMMGNLTIENGHIVANQYFLGTMLFIGNFAEGTDQEIQVVDGQQRLTTITILFSALSDRFTELGEETLSRQIFSYIMTEDDDGNEVRILKTRTSYPFFAYFIQDKGKKIQKNADSEEETCIKEAYDYFRSQLKDNKLKELIIKKDKRNRDKVNSLKEINILKALRDQVLNSTFVSISTKDRDQANRIFEILNAKGKRLADIDLIKNKIFELLKKEEPADFAEETWKKIKSTINTGKETVGLATYYRHFWISKYKKTYSNKLYDAFNSTINKSEKAYSEFLEDMLHNAEIYMKIVNPKREDYDNRKEYYWLVQSLNVLNNYFNVVQVRIALLALFEAKDRKVINSKIFKEAVLYLENFHFAYNAICSGNPNKLEKIYSTFAISLRKAAKKDEARKIIQGILIDPLDKLFPSYDDFYKKFILLTYSKKDNPSNMKAKYVINKLNCYFWRKETFEDDGSVEHLVPESAGEQSLSIGNLILLEDGLNVKAGEEIYTKKREIYKESKYDWIKNFCIKYQTWDHSMINKRAEDMAKFFYIKILKKKISENYDESFC